MMRAIILTIGDELVVGQTPDTNSTYLAGSLIDLGIVVTRLTSVGDDVAEISREVEQAIRDADMVFVTGGLGPTEDDVTKQGVARALGRNLVVDPRLHERLRSRFKGHASATPEVIKALATIPQHAKTIDNPVGAAVGLAIDHAGKTVFVLPGVPHEMEAVFTGGIMANLKVLPKAEVVLTRVLKTTGLRESAIAEKLKAAAGEIEVRLGYLPGPVGVDLRLAVSARDKASAGRILDEAARRIMLILGRHVYSSDGEEMHTVVGRQLIETGTTIAIAESCTGGLIGHLLTQVPDISASLDRVIVSYSNRAKVENLGVSEDALARYGAVSPEVAEEMARGVRTVAASDLGLSTTGIAGPGGGTEEKPVGLVYFGLADEGGCSVSRMVFKGTRQIIKLKAAAYALNMVRCHLLDLGE